MPKAGAQRLHATYWWQIVALLEFEAEMWRLEALLHWANVELRNDEYMHELTPVPFSWRIINEDDAPEPPFGVIRDAE